MSFQKKYAQIIISLTNKSIDKPFDYEIPQRFQDKISVGMRAFIPFGGKGKKYEGYITGISDQTDCPEDKIKQIIDLPDDFPVFSEEMLRLASWMKTKYYTTMSTCLKCIMPSGISMKSDYLITLADGFSVNNPINSKLGQKQKQVLSFISNSGGAVLKSEISNAIEGDIFSSINSLEKKNIIKINEQTKIKDLKLIIKYASLNHENDELSSILESEGDSPQERVVRLLYENGSMAISDIKSILNISNSPIKTLEKNMLINIESIETRRNVTYLYERDLSPPELTQQQQDAADFLINRFNAPVKNPVLIHGVTGSGKTEIYMRLINHAIEHSMQAIMLVPEISLTPQTVETFLRRFGNKVSFTHSRLSPGERYDQWKKARNSEISVIIGPRSAIFSPFSKLGVIIIDEEHESTYKSETTPKYCAKEVALELGRITGAMVVFGSATPSVEYFFATSEKRIDLITLTERVNNMLPQVHIVDMRQELAEGNRSVFSAVLFNAIEDNLNRGKQIILFLNRRGHSTFVSCRKCGYVIKCDKCSVNYTYHMYSNELVCHYCGGKSRNPENCPVCGSKFIKYFGVGTQKLEEETKKLFNANILRMDFDTTSGKNNHEKILTSFREGHAQILIGTQMIAKGLDFPNVTLVGVIAADLSLNNGDYRAGENTFQLLTQVSGRAGRASSMGEVYIQTYNPEHYAIIYASENDYDQFYRHEIVLRRQMGYPPYSHIFIVLFTGQSEKKIITTLYKLLDIMNAFNRKSLFNMLGPAPAIISKIKNQYRWKIIVKAMEEEKLRNFVIYCIDKLKEYEDMSDIVINMTLDPTVIC